MDTSDLKPSQYMQTIKTDSKTIGPYCAGKIVSPQANTVYLSGALGMDRETLNLVSDDVVEQTRQAMKNIGFLLEKANSGFHNIVKCTVYLIDMSDFAKVNEEYATYFKNDYPARVCIAVHQLPKGARVEIDVIAVQNE